jgi:hypothetical protein
MSLVEVLKKTLSVNSTSQNGNTDDSQLYFIKSRKAMLKELASSQENGTLLGVHSRALGEGMFLVSVNFIETDHPNEVIIFETYDQSGMILNRNRVSIDEIKMICPLNKKYVNPILNKVKII